MNKVFLTALIALTASSAAFGQNSSPEKSLELPIAKLTLKAIDEQGTPVVGAAVRMGFEEAIPIWGGGNVVLVKGVTNQDGEFTGEGHSFDTKGGEIRKDGFYSSSPESFKFKQVVEKKWQPWNPVLNVTLKKVVNPIPMYAKKLQIEIPQVNGPVGFDLEIGDWINPYGKGVTSDILFTLQRKFTDRRDYKVDVTITFPNKGDGIQFASIEDANSGSELKLPRFAPESGYAPEFKTAISSVEGAPGNHNFFFRVRTVLDADGKVKSARYGKIDGDIQLDPINSKTCLLLFTYYFNPTTNDRNMEFSPQRNLFTNLTPDERVVAP